MLFFIVQFVVFLSLSILSSVADSSPPSSTLSTTYALLLLLPSLAFGATFTLIPAMVSEVYGTSNFGKFFGWLQFSSTAAAVATPLVAAAIYSEFNSFSALFYAISALLLASVVALSTRYDAAGAAVAVAMAAAAAADEENRRKRALSSDAGAL